MTSKAKSSDVKVLKGQEGGQSCDLCYFSDLVLAEDAILQYLKRVTHKRRIYALY